MLSDPSQGTNPLVISYLGIRRAIGAAGLLLPVVLGPVGWLIFGVDFQDNMSLYYHTAMRDVLVGALFTIGAFLFCYHGYDEVENWTANIAGFAALGLALFPIDAEGDPLHQRSLTGWVHAASGGVFFLALAFYSLYHFPTSREDKHEDVPNDAERRFVYRASGAVILLSMLAMGAYLLVLPESWTRPLNDYNFLFWMEWVAVWAFAAAWLTKGRAILAEIAVDLLSRPMQLLRKDD